MANKSYGRIYNFKQNVSITPRDIYNLYPVGSIYMSVVNVNPTQYFGGTWERFGVGRTVVSVDDTQTDFNAPMKVGGEKTHVLTVNEMPRHTHDIIRDGGNTKPMMVDTGRSAQWGSYIGQQSSGYTAESLRIEVTTTGDSQAHNNMPPYITVYMWRRVA